MTKLEAEIWVAVIDLTESMLKVDMYPTEKDKAKAAAVVAKEYIKRAIVDTHKNHTDVYNDPNKAMSAVDFYDYWLKENGVI